MKLLTLGNTKTVKGEAKGYMTFIMHLAPANLSGRNVCPMASAGCKSACLNTAGRGQFDSTQRARIKKTHWFFDNRDSFMTQLVKDIRSAIKSAEKKGFIPVFRLNGTSDIRWETVEVFDNKEKDVIAGLYLNVMTLFPTVQFYDYTKLPNRKDLPKNYHLTFSRSEENDAILPTIEHNIAVVFSGKELPKTYIGKKVISGDEDDLRFLDKKNVVVGLLAKGKGKKDTSGFVVNGVHLMGSM